MFAKIKKLFNKKNKALRNKIYFTFLCLLIYKIGTGIIVPGVDASSLKSGLSYFELFNLMSGGSIENFSILSLGVMPYISAQIIMQFLELDIVPYFSELAKQGGVGRMKLNQITRVLGILIAFVQGYIFSFRYVSGGVSDYMLCAVVLTAGTCFLLWLGDQITTKGVGNGISIIIMAGIIANLPNMFMTAYTSLITTGDLQTVLFGVTKFILFVMLYLLIVIGVIYEETAERRITIQYSNKTNSLNGTKNYLPFKLNAAGVMPVILASVVMSIPSIIAALLSSHEKVGIFVNKYLITSSVTGFVLYILLIYVFAYVYTFLQVLKPDKISEDLSNSGGFIPGIRPGNETKDYLSLTLKRITFTGATFLAVLAALPIIFGAITNLPTNVSLGGTGLLIVIGVTIETYKQIDSEMSNKEYRGVRRRR